MENRTTGPHNSFVLETLKSVSAESMRDWRRKILRKETPPASREAYVLALHEMISTLEDIYSALLIQLPEDIREAAE